MTLYDVFDRLELTFVGQTMADSIWLFPVVEAVHLLGLAGLGGAVLVVDLRLLGLAFPDREARYLLAESRPWFLGAIATLFATGIPLFLSEAVKCYWSQAFWVKMGALALALLFTWSVRNRRIRDSRELGVGRARLLGGSSIALWTTVAAAGRWIGFS